MNIGLCVRIVGLLLMLFSLGTLPSMTLGWLQEDGTATIFGQAFAATATSGFSWLATQRVKSELQIRRWLHGHCGILDRFGYLWCAAIFVERRRRHFRL